MQKLSLIAIFVLMLTGHQLVKSQEYPLIGAQVFIEPGQSDEETEVWFKTMRENGMNICRIRMFESYMKNSDGTWDFSLFDRAFRYAEKYDIKVYGTFFPATVKTDIGGWKFPESNHQLKLFAEYIKQCVLHFRQFKSLYGWVLINEPGGGLKNNEFTREMRSKWNRQNPVPDNTAEGYPILVDLQDGRFANYMTSWMLNWIAGEVRKYDADIHLHVNNHAIFDHVPEYDFPYWRTFLNSFGGSAHASWHFGKFDRKQYALAMSANCQIILSGTGNKPWLMTELQGGNNTYSGLDAMCPTPEEITQWLWIVLASEGKGGIFWSLNPRSSGIESGEWAMLDFQNNTSDRLTAVSNVIKSVQQHRDIFANAKYCQSGINILYVRESMWAEGKLDIKTPNDVYEARQKGGVIKSALGYFETLSQMGVNSNFKAIEEFDFKQNDYSGQVIILAHQIALPDSYVDALHHFVGNGGKLIVEGLTAFYNESMLNTMKTGFRYEKLFGATVSEFKLKDRIFDVQLGIKTLPAHAWQGYLNPKSGVSIAESAGKSIAVRNKVGKGEVLWIPALLGLGARIQGYKPLSEFLEIELQKQLSGVPIRFSKLNNDVMMKTVKSGDSYITVLINKTGKVQKIKLLFREKVKSSLIYSKEKDKVLSNLIVIQPESTFVIKWN